jgi:hypothetical protein
MVKRLVVPLFALMVAACTATRASEVVEEGSMSEAPDALPAPVVARNLGPAPEIENEVWLNVGGPLRLADLRGRVVLLEMWTFG